MNNKAIREWYLQQISLIPDLNESWIREGLKPEERARKAWGIRHEARLKARRMMEDPDEVEMLRRRDVRFYGNEEGPTFEYLVNQAEEVGLQGNAIYEFIIATSSKSNVDVNTALGLLGKGT